MKPRKNNPSTQHTTQDNSAFYFYNMEQKTPLEGDTCAPEGSVKPGGKSRHTAVCVQRDRDGGRGNVL
jgi:hypothetical protein